MASSTRQNASTTTTTRASGRRREPTSTRKPDPAIDATTRAVVSDPGDQLGRKIIDLHGLRIAVKQRGYSTPDGPRPLLLINGIGATGELFEPFVDAMEILGDREIITFDAPGVGFSSTPLYPPTIRQLARLIADMIDALEHREVDVLGLSWGGALAQELAYRHPDKVGRLVLTATMHGWTSTPGRPAAMSILLSPTRYYSPQYLYQVAPTLYGGAIRNNRSLIREHAQVRASRPPSTLGYTWQLMALRRWTSWPWLKNLTQPTLIMAGDDDPIIPASNAEAMAGEIPNCELEIVDGGHLFLYTQPTETAKRIHTFLVAGDESGSQPGRTRSVRGRFITDRPDR